MLMGFFFEAGDSLELFDLPVFAGAFVLLLLVGSRFPRTILYPMWWALFWSIFWTRHGTFWVWTHSIWRLRSKGRENVPKTGPALLVSNHVSYVDWLMIWVSSPRAVRFVVWKRYFDNPFLGLLLRNVGALPMDSAGGPRAIVQSLQAVVAALKAGEVVCIFPEARLSRNGKMLPFQRGIERILQDAPVPVVPVYLHGLWGSIFSYRYGKMFTRLPETFCRPVWAIYGEPLPPSTPVPEIRQRIQELAAEGGRLAAETLPTPPQGFIRRACRRPFRNAFIDTTTSPPRHLSYLKVLAGAMCLRDWLRSRVGTEQHLGLWLPSSSGSAVANIAVAFLNRTAVNLNYTAGIDAVHSAIRQTGLKYVLTSKRFLARMPLTVPDGVTVIHLEDALADITSGKRLTAALQILLPSIFLYPLGWFWANGPGAIVDRLFIGAYRQRLDDILTVIFSSGSTGEPKGVMLSHRNIAANIESVVRTIDLVPTDRFLAVLPFFHSFGYTVTLWAPLQVPMSAVYHADPRQAKEVGELCKTFGCTLLISTATFLRFYLRRCAPDDFKSLRILVCGAEKLPVALTKEVQERFGIEPLEGYGCTELSPVVSVNLPNVEVGKVKQIANKLGTIGQPINGVSVKIVDPESMARLSIGTEGMVVVRGANVMVGYLGRPEQTAKAIRDGWYITGDMGKLDEDGFITLTGRLARFAKIAGEMVPLERLEEELHEAVGITERLFAVAAVNDEKRGERIVVLHLAFPDGLDAKTTLAKLETRGLPNLWIPSERDFYGIPEMPVLGSGKLDLKRVKDLAEELAGKK